MLQYQTLFNGDRSFPSRGKPPPEQAGFTRDTGDAYLFHLNYQECTYRKKDVKVTPCKRRIPFLHCTLKVIQVDALICQGCKERKEESKSELD